MLGSTENSWKNDKVDDVFDYKRAINNFHPIFSEKAGGNLHVFTL